MPDIEALNPGEDQTLDKIIDLMGRLNQGEDVNFDDLYAKEEKKPEEPEEKK